MFCYSAGQTRRWHTRDHVIRTETIAAHSWNTTMWILLLHPSPSKNLIFASMVHDVPEHLTGDVPRWAKEESQWLRDLLENLEDKILAAKDLQCDLEEDDAKWLKAVDLFDAWLFIRQNILAGNRLMMDAWQRSTKALNEMPLPPELAEVYEDIKWGDKI
jgi:5'-deoxynucleotidase YfbR-like HD superfamily hydrolase